MVGGGDGWVIYQTKINFFLGPHSNKNKNFEAQKFLNSIFRLPFAISNNSTCQWVASVLFIATSSKVYHSVK